MNYKQTTNGNHYSEQPINTGVFGQYYCYNDILQKLYERMNFMTSKHARVLFVRFDIRFPHGYETSGRNVEIGWLFKVLQENANNNGIHLAYVWVRECKSSSLPHYHAVLMVDGRKVRNYRNLLMEVERIWGRVLGTNAKGLIDWCDKPHGIHSGENGVMLQQPLRDATRIEQDHQQQEFDHNYKRCFERASYLAKVSQKEDTPHGVRRFGCSQLR
ncbi:YagK/YfjJ domain-containing protein [Paucidesulfovibrio longus]|uniref:YagK/YfjJ domain-containing protein n=1 Tax=Paucidesulfovibrio longus TaxID=889 RepID=UPI0009DC12F7|nr:inovirus-type Gp2 protein [Paucidesulfovibrio longus]